ncbi:MAG: hypothetical protein JOZ96_26980 [Acidobacteria bacterium]|nr:hypothetical protein [Acidobacteriota bacterium]
MQRRFLSALILTLTFAICVAAQERPLWQIGSFDGSSDEFGAQAEGPFDAASGQAKNWGATQQAVVESKADAAAARRIRFELADAPSGTYTLRLGLIMTSPRLPVVQLEVNGHKGWFYQRPESEYKEGNLEAYIFPQYAYGVLPALIPAEFLRQGANEITLTAVADPASTALPGGEDTSDAVLRYDALALVRWEGWRPVEAGWSRSTLHVAPTALYRREGGQLCEVVHVVRGWTGKARPGTLRLSVGGWNATRDLSTGREFGEQRFEFLVPEFGAGAAAKVSLSDDRNESPGRGFTFKLTPKRKWTVYLVPHEHLDIGYSDFQTKLAELHSRVIDEALEMSAERPEFKFSLDGYWQAQQFLEGRSEAERQKFYDAVRRRKIFVPAQHSVMLTGTGTAETLLRSFYASHKFNREHGGPWDYVNITDVPSYTWSYASILAAAGIKYFSAAANADRGPTLMLGNLHRRSPFWWEGPDGSRVLLWYARHYHQIGSQFGLPPKLANGYEGLQTFLETYERPDYAPGAVLLHGSQWENTSLHKTQADIVREWNAQFEYPRLVFSGFGEALGQISKGVEEKLPVVRGDGGPYWEDGVASDAAHAAAERLNERRAVSAEKLSTLAALVDPRSSPPRDALASMWDSIFVMNEHTWGWGRSVTEPHSEDSERELAYKRLRASMARDQLEYVLERAMTTIAGSVETPQRALVVFNTLNWRRDGWVEFDLQKTREIVDLETQRVVPFEVLEDHPAYQRIRFMARGVPSVGYRTYQVRDKAASQADAGTAPSTSTSPEAQADTLENSFYRVRFDAESGSIKSVFDKQLGRELVDASSPYRFGQYVYVKGGDEPARNQLLTYRKTAPVARLEIHKATRGRLASVGRTPTGARAVLESSAPNTPRVETEVLLFDDAKKIEINYRVRKETVYKKEGVYFAFPVAARDPRFHFDVQSTVVDPAKEMMPGAGLEWFSSQNWASVGDEQLTVAVVNRDSFLWTFGDIVRGTWPKEFKPASPVLFSYAMNNYWNTNYVAAQGGEFLFRYVLTSAREFDQTALARLGWEETTPLERTLVKAQDQTYPARKALPAAQSSLLDVDNPSVLLSAWKPAEDGAGTVMRFIELGGAREQVSVGGALLDDAAVSVCNAVEECGPPAPAAKRFGFSLGPRQIYTVKVSPTR